MIHKYTHKMHKCAQNSQMHTQNLKSTEDSQMHTKFRNAHKIQKYTHNSEMQTTFTNALKIHKCTGQDSEMYF